MGSQKHLSKQGRISCSTPATVPLSRSAPKGAVQQCTSKKSAILTVARTAPNKRQTVAHAVSTNEDLVLIGDAAATLTNVPDGVVQTVVTSPPYWSLRDYDADGQIGMNEPLPIYIKSLVSVFDEVRRVLVNDGTVWVNIGDSYTSGNRAWRAPYKKNPARAMSVRPPTPEGLKDKDLIGVPWRFALAMQDAGWWLRSDIIWYKPNCQPESVRDRPTRSHEHIFLFSKSDRYHYDIDAVRAPNGRRLRDVWDINTVGYPGAHFATFPPRTGATLHHNWLEQERLRTRSFSWFGHNRCGGADEGATLHRL